MGSWLHRLLLGLVLPILLAATPGRDQDDHWQEATNAGRAALDQGRPLAAVDHFVAAADPRRTAISLISAMPWAIWPPLRPSIGKRSPWVLRPAARLTRQSRGAVSTWPSAIAGWDGSRMRKRCIGARCASARRHRAVTIRTWRRAFWALRRVMPTRLGTPRRCRSSAGPWRFRFQLWATVTQLRSRPGPALPSLRQRAPGRPPPKPGC